MRHTKILSLLLCLALVLTLLPGMAAYADGVAYLDASGASQTHSAEPVSGSSWSSGWYVANPGTTNIGSRITVNGNVHLILADGATLNANEGITVEGDNSLTIYAQSTGGNMGTLNATGAGDEYGPFPAGIGSYENAAGTVVINGGNITTTGYSAEYGGGAGIGGCYNVDTYEGTCGGNVTINGGNVTAIGGTASPGIGDGPQYASEYETVHTFGKVTINGGSVTAIGNSVEGGGGAAGIGGGYASHGVNVDITGGTVTATGGTGAAGIGGGVDYYQIFAPTINITGGSVTATGGDGYSNPSDYINYGYGAGIGGGSNSDNDADLNRGKLYISDNLTIYAGGNPNPTTTHAFDGNFPGWPYFKSKHDYQYVIIVGEPSDTPVESVSLDKTDAQTVTVGGNVAFTATVAPDDATDKTVKWSVGGTNASAVKLYSDANCSTEVGTDATDTLTVYAKGISAGSATVTVTSNADDTKTASCAVTVKMPVTGVTLDKSALTLDVGGTETLTATVLPDNATDKTVTWKSDTPTVATVENGVVTAVAPGTATITVTTTDGNFTASCTVTVNKLDLTVTAPTAKTLSYTGSAQELVTAGTVNVGTMQYAVTTENAAPEASAYAAAVPTAVNAGSYYVWYKVPGNASYNDFGAASVTVTVNKADITPVVTIEGWTRGDAANTPNITGNPGSGAVTYTYKAKGAEDSAYSATVPSAAGEYTVKADIAATENYNAASATADFTIAEKAFGTADFTLPADIRTVEDNAFEGAAMKIVYVPDTCTAIGAGAFKNCRGLLEIRLPKDCAVSDSAFEGCGTVWVFAPAGGTTEQWCQGKTNIAFVSCGE